MNILYTRVSTIEQSTDRQRLNEKDYNMVIEDKCSGAIPFFEREGGKKILKLLNKKEITSISVWTIDRLGRDLRDIINTLHHLTERGIPVKFISQGLVTIDENGKENPIGKMIISILGIVGEMEKSQIKERQREGIAIAKAKGTYQGRAKGAKEDLVSFLSKKKNKQAIEMFKRGLKGNEIMKNLRISPTTLSKIKKLSGIKKIKE